jgi:hypothetical protein
MRKENLEGVKWGFKNCMINLIVRVTGHSPPDMLRATVTSIVT